LVLYFWQKEGLLKLKNYGGHSSFVFLHLCLAKSKVCPPFNNYFPKKEGLFKINVVYIIYIILNKFNIVTCMKVTGEIFSFQKKRKEAEEARY